MFSKTLLVSALAALATAQSSVLTFTKVPNPVTDGQPQALTYATNDTASPVTIVLRKGASGNLQTVTTLTSSATGGQYIWTPPKGLANDNDYALEIRQGSQVNYYGPFVVQGADSSASGYPTSSASMSATASANSTSTTPAPIVPVGTAGSMSAGTGTAMPRNTTMSMATLTGSSSATGTGSSTASTSGAGFQGSSTGSSPSASSTSSGASSNVQIGSSIAFIGAIAAAVLLQ